MAGAAYTSLFDNALLARLERLRLVSQRKLTSRNRGEHMSGKGGPSTEFADYRDYTEGDDLRAVDWNIFARLQRPYVKLYRMEEEMHLLILVDASASMCQGDKLLMAQRLAAAFAVMGLMNLEPVSVYTCHHRGREPQQIRRATGRVSLKRVCAFLEGVAQGGDFPIEEAIQSVLKTHRGRGMAVVISDFLTFGDLQRPLNLLYSAGMETLCLQVLSPGEIEPELNGDLRLVDCETASTLDISGIGGLLEVYREHLANLQTSLANLCRQRQGRFATVNSATAIEHVLFDTLRRQGWIA